jgi:DNA-binding MarR family transcriptional regulator
MTKTYDVFDFRKIQKKLEKTLGKNETKFLKQLMYWSTHPNNYGIERNEKAWIYNTLEDWAKQLVVSKSTIQRAIRLLKSKGLVETSHQATNKYNRILFYSINHEVLDEFIKTQIRPRKPCRCTHVNDYLNDHMYIRNNKQIINKSYKSKNNFSKNILENKKLETTKDPKNTTIQDMLQEVKTKLPELSILLNKDLARKLVAAFKIKFRSSIEEWRKFLKLIKTSTYLMSEKFKLTLNWMLKFSTVDRLKLGELGVKVSQIFDNKLTEEELQSKVEQQFSGIEEPEEHKVIRKQILEKTSKAVYLAWFKDLRFVAEDNLLKVLYPNRFVEDTIKVRFSENFNRLGIVL